MNENENTASTAEKNAAKNSKAKIILPIVIAVVVLGAAVGILIAVLGNKKPSDILSSGDYTSPTALAASEDGKYLYVADATGCAVYKISTADKKVEAVYQADVRVNDVAVSGDTVLVAEGELGGRLVRLDKSFKESAAVVTGHTPSDICISGGSAYVANRYSDTVSCVDISSMKETANIAVSREPVTLTLAGGDLYVGCHLPNEAANTGYTSADVCVIETAGNTLVKTLDLCNGAGSVLGICSNSDGTNVYVTHIVARYQLPTTQLDGGWINTNAVTVIDASEREVYYSFLLDDVDLGAANPWGITISDDDSTLYVALSGTNQISKVDLKKLRTLANKVSRDSSMNMTDIVDMIDFAADAKSRITLDAAGVRTVLLSGGKLYAGEYFAGSVAVIDEDSFVQTDTILIKEQPGINDVRQGELYFYDATTCYQMWQSCNSCHPDVRADSLNWDNLNDGIGTSKQAKSLLWAHRTPPEMITGIRKNAEIANEAGYKFIQYNADYAEYVPYINAFLKSLLPVQSPYLNNDGTLTAAAEHGRELFSKYNCAQCHPAPLYTDRKLHESADLELGDDWEYRPLDTPTLIEVWRTSPWTYNGYFTDMSEYIKFMIEKRGMTISDADAADLAEYVLSIGIENENYGVVQLINDDSEYNAFNEKAPIVKINIIKQIAGTPDGVATITVYDSADKELTSTDIELKDMKYGVLYEFELDKPLETAGGSYAVVSIRDASGNALASDLKID